MTRHNHLLTFIGILFLSAIFITPWIVNAARLASCDFKPPYKCELIHGLGTVTPTCFVTMWFQVTEEEKGND